MADRGRTDQLERLTPLGGEAHLSPGCHAVPRPSWTYPRIADHAADRRLFLWVHDSRDALVAERLQYAAAERFLIALLAGWALRHALAGRADLAHTGHRMVLLTGVGATAAILILMIHMLGN